MTVRTTPSFLQAGSHPAEETRLMVAGLLGVNIGAAFSGGVGATDPGHGVTGSGHMKVTATGTPDMNVHVAIGGAFIRGTQSVFQGVYEVVNDADLPLAIATADATNPRRDLVIAQVRDSAYSGATNDARIVVVTGTPAASPSDPSLAAYPNALVLARVAVAAGATSITNANITDLRAMTAGLGGSTVCTSTSRPPVPWKGQRIYETDTGQTLVYYGATTGWRKPWGDAWGQAFKSATPSSTSITTGTSLVTIITWANVPMVLNRRYALFYTGSLEMGNTDAFNVFLVVGGSTVETGREAFLNQPRHASEGTFDATSTGNVTVGINAQRVSGSSNMGPLAGMSQSLIVMDIGPATSTVPTD